MVGSMLRCSDVAERASALVDGELGGWDRLKVRAHLAMCGACRAFVVQIRVARNLARAAGDHESTAGEADAGLARLYARLDQHPNGRG